MLQRGWIGGEYKTAKRNNLGNLLSRTEAEELSLPAELAKERRSAIIVKQVSANTPASIAGLQPDDFILAVNNHPVGNLKQFHKLVDRTEPGQELNLKAYRRGETIELPVRVGTETYKKGGLVVIVFPTVVHGWNLFFHPGLSLVFIGCEPSASLRHELGKEDEKYEEDWKAYAGIVEVSSGKRVVRQEAAAENH
jgi:hypothetical protein